MTLQELSREPMILLDAVPSKNYFISIFKEKGYHPEVAYSSPSIEMVRCMVGRARFFGAGHPALLRYDLRWRKGGAARYCR